MDLEFDLSTLNKNQTINTIIHKGLPKNPPAFQSSQSDILMTREKALKTLKTAIIKAELHVITFKNYRDSFHFRHHRFDKEELCLEEQKLHLTL